MSRNLARFLSSTPRVRGAWSEFATRPASLKVADKTARTELFEGAPPSGPSSLKIKEYRKGYNSPELIQDTFKLAYELLEQDASAKYSHIEANKANMSASELEEALVRAEEYNPEVLYNAQVFPEKLDRSVAIYRKILKEKWQEYGQMLTMQRLEQLHIIPDTLPTLAPEVEVKIKFSHNDEKEFADWVVPGSKMPAFAVAKPPTIEIQEFDPVEDGTGLYSVLIVNPDIPCLETNGFKTSLNFALQNVPLDFVNNTITPLSLLEHPEWVLKEYTPLLPERNSPTHRACVWVFRQNQVLNDVEVNSDSFDIRSFVESNGLQPVGAHVWRQDYDRSTNRIRAEYGLEKGRVFHPIRNLEPLM